MDSLVSVVIPTYNRGYTIERAIRSVINQSYKNLEIIIIDDASTDNTREIISRINDNRIKYIAHNQRKGPSSARNTGIKTSCGEFISFLDSDDEYLPDKIERSLEVIRNKSLRIGMVASLYYIIENGRERIASEGKINLKRYIPLLSTWVVRRDVFKKIGFFNEAVLIGEDAEFFWRFRKKFSFVFIPHPLVRKYMTPDMSHASKEKILKLRKKTIINLWKQKDKKLTARLLNILGKDYRGQRNYKLAKKYFLMAFKIYPFNLGYLINFFKTRKCLKREINKNCSI